MDINNLPKYDFFEGLRTLETEKKVQEHMTPLCRKIYLSFGFIIKTLMFLTAFNIFSYYILKYQNDFMLLSLYIGAFGMIGLSIIKQTMRKIIRGRYNL